MTTEPTVRTISYLWPMEPEDQEYARFLNEMGAGDEVKKDGIFSYGFLLYRAEPELFERGKREWRENRLKQELDRAQAELTRFQRAHGDYEARYNDLLQRFTSLQLELKRAKRATSRFGSERPLRGRRKKVVEAQETSTNGNS